MVTVSKVYRLALSLSPVLTSCLSTPVSASVILVLSCRSARSSHFSPVYHPINRPNGNVVPLNMSLFIVASEGLFLSYGQSVETIL